ncbi:MAG TPA: universal stress protein [Burkholderiales bacterium]|nr:universal stress protein [Burkholderiales bacterium]
MFKHILLTTDGSDLSENAARSAMAFAKSNGARVTGLYVLQEYTPILATEGFGYVDPVTVEQFEKSAESYGKNCLAFIEREAKAAGVECDCHVETGFHIYETVIKIAEEKGCDLIWMASHGRKGVAGFLLGSETTKVLTHSPIPVLVYK